MYKLVPLGIQMYVIYMVVHGCTGLYGVHIQVVIRLHTRM